LRDWKGKAAMKRCLLAEFCLGLGLVVSTVAFGSAQDPRTVAFPVGVYSAIEGADRFQPPAYFEFFLRDGIKRADAHAIFECAQTAAKNRENYKALFLMRVFTQIKPDLPAAWINRAALAQSLGLPDEAAASAVHANNPTISAPVPLGVVPGVGLSVRPTTLADWAAALALVGDSVSAKEGDRVLVAVRDDLSGLTLADPDKVRESDQELINDGLSPMGPYAIANPLTAEVIPANLFVLEHARPMSYSTVQKGKMFAAFLMSALSGYTQNTQGAAAAGQLAGDATEVASYYNGGSYDKGTYTSAAGKLTFTHDHPKSSGKSFAVGSPRAVLWASGPSTLASYLGRWTTDNNPPVASTPPGKPWDRGAKGSIRGVPDLYYPRLMSFCAENCTYPMSMLEVMLTPDDLGRLAPPLSQAVPYIESEREAYLNGTLTVESGNAGDDYVGFDRAGTVYRITTHPSQPAGWLVKP
jgi:hypothetical protein